MTFAHWLSRLLPFVLPASLGGESSIEVLRSPVHTVGGSTSYPQIIYHSTTVTVPVVHVEKWDRSCDAESYILLSPHGNHIADNKVLLLNYRGELVWYHQEKGAVHNIQVQRYRGKDYITYWVGDDEFWGHGAGYYKMYDQTYTLAYTLSAGNGLDGDYHEFSITPQNTALITAFVKTPWDLSTKGRERGGFIWDCVFQEIDIETNTLIFEWRASDHYHFDDIAVDSWTSWTGTAQDPWDWFHLNSVQKDVQGNFLVAARYTKGVTYVSGMTGKRLWQLGGVRNSFRDLSGGSATTFVDPHMVRWDDDGGALTVFDNIDHRTLGQPAQSSRGAKIELDMTERTARLSLDFKHPQGVYAHAEGSLQRLKNGNYLVAYGSTPVYSEFSPTGQHLCETHWAPMHESDGILQSASSVDTYRVYKSSWSGSPSHPPTIKYTSDALHLHWNGATQVRSWRIEARSESSPRYRTLGQYQHDAFEIMVPLAQTHNHGWFRLTALDESRNLLGMWHVDLEGNVHEIFFEASQWSSVTLSYVLLIVMGMGVAGYRSWRKAQRLRRRVSHSKA